MTTLLYINWTPFPIFRMFMLQSALDLFSGFAVNSCNSRVSNLKERPHLFLVETETQKGKNNYVLKRYNQDTVDGARVCVAVWRQFCASEQQRARFSRLAALLPIPQKGDDEYIYACEEAGASVFYLAMEYLEGDEDFDFMRGLWTEAHCSEAGRLLAAMHAVSLPSSLDPLLLANRPDISNKYLAGRLKEGLISIGRLSKSGESADEEAEAMVATLLSATKRPFPLPMPNIVINHGDVHPGNIIYNQGQALAFIDFDYACAGNPLHDLGYAVFMFGFDNKLDPFREEAGLITVMGAALIQAYFEAQSQSFDQEPVVDALLPYCGLAALHSFLWLASEAAIKENPLRESHKRAALFSIDYLEAVLRKLSSS